MFCGNKTCFFITFLVLVVLKQHVVFGEPQVPCYFIFGDSSVDSGNNNNMTFTRGNYLPYGIDFVNGPTGRFTNARTIVDIISELLGLNDFIPSFLSATGNATLGGVNYGSSGSGILMETNIDLGILGLDRQLVNHMITVSRIIQLQQNPTFTGQYLSKCLYSVSTGANDYISNYIRPPSRSPLERLYTPQRFADSLIQTYSRQMRTLYYLGARKVAIFGVGSIGCLPIQLRLFNISGSACAESTNNNARLFDSRLVKLVRHLNHEFRDARFTFINTTSISQNPSASITNTRDPCCTVSQAGLCVPDTVPCSDRNAHQFYDTFHTSEITNIGRATRSYNAQSPFDAYPVDIRRLVQLQ